MADLDRIKRNVAKMVGMDAPETDIDAYIAEEGVTIEEVRAHRPGIAAVEPANAEEPASFREAQRQAATEDRGALAASTTGGAQGWSLGATDEIMAGAFTPLEMAIGALTGEDADKGLLERARDAYARGLDLQRSQISAARENHPGATFAGELAGGAVTGGVGLGAAKSTAGRMAVGAAEGVGFGGVAGFMSGEGTEDRLERAEDGAQLGAGVGAAFPLVGAVAGAAVRGGRSFVEPFTEAGRERIAARRLEDGATDPEALRRSLEEGAEELVPGSQPTTGQMSGDMGVLAMERTAQTRDPVPFQQRRADQNAARVDALTGVQPEGAPEAVATALRQRIQAIDDETQAALDAATAAARDGTDHATRAAQDAAGAIGPGATPDVAGDRMRGALETARANAKAQERALWAAVDPDGTLALSTSNVREQALELRRGTPASAKPPSGEEAAILDVVGAYKETMPFSELTALQSRLKAEMRAERMANGETPAYARMARLNSSVQADLETAVAGKVAQEADAVARGEMRVEDTLEASWLRQREDWFAGRRAAQDATARAVGGETTAGSGAAGAFRSSAVSPASGANRQAGRGVSDPSSDPRLPANDIEPNFDADALGRLNQARDATRERVSTFDNPTLAPIRQGSSAADRRMPASAVPGSIFRPGARGFDSVETYRRAVGNDPEAMGAIRDFAVDSFQRKAARPDGTIDPAKAQTWRNMHRDALRAFPDLEAQLQAASGASEAMAGAARQADEAVTAATRGRDQAMRTAREGRIGQLAGAIEPSDVTKSVGGVFSSRTPAQDMLKLRTSLGKDEAAREGLRKSVIDYMTSRFVGNTEAATSGVGTMKSDTFQGFVSQNRAALRSAGFTDDEIGVMDRIAEDLQRANRSLTATRIPGQSNTAQDLTAIQTDDKPTTILGKVVANMMSPAPAGAVGGVGIVAGGGGLGSGLAVAGAGVVAQVVSAMRRNGLEKVEDIVRDALLNPERARLLLATAKGKGEEKAMTRLAESYARSATVAGSVGMEREGPREETAAAAPSFDRERAASPRLTEEDRASPISPDLIDDGKAIMDGRPIEATPTQARGGRVAPPTRPEGASDADVIAQARAAIGRGASVTAVRERLVSFGVDPEQAGL